MNGPSADTGLPRKRIISCVFMNLAVTPGLGSLMARRWAEGAGQVAVSVAGFALIMVWFYKVVVVQFYGQFTGNVTVEPAGYIGVTGAVLFVVAWVWSLFTGVSLLRTAQRGDTASLKLFAAGQVRLDEVKIAAGLATVAEWQRNGLVISRQYQFKDFSTAMKFVNAVGALAEQAQHHPDIDVRWNQVTLAFTTHDAGGLTGRDFALARACDAQASNFSRSQPPKL